ncbi:hypothetical protein QE152_g41616 [Popillia japonica]|uniref:Uncharacterized protein n=1 Tax=Popillia japonica TaxID=7064 RepID=A0AAW1G987_POPJA
MPCFGKDKRCHKEQHDAYNHQHTEKVLPTTRDIQNGISYKRSHNGGYPHNNGQQAENSQPLVLPEEIGYYRTGYDNSPAATYGLDETEEPQLFRCAGIDTGDGCCHEDDKR